MRKLRATVRDPIALAALMLALALGVLAYTIIHNQAERRQAILSNCQDQNRRHVATLKELHKLTDRQPQGRGVEAFAELLIDRLAPLQNCSAVLSKATSTK